VRTKVVIYLIAAVMVSAFFIANWALLSSPVSLNFLFARVEMPLALLLLLCAGVVLLLDLVVHASADHAWRAERRRLVTEVAGARMRAERAEVEESRSQGLQATLEREFSAVRAQLDRVLTGVQQLENDTMEVPLPGPSAIEPELIPPRPATRRG